MEWTHRICERCWFDGVELYDVRAYALPRHLPIPGLLPSGAYRMPVQMKEAEPEACCVCGGMTITGIFFRHDQEDLLCLGRHDDPAAWSRVAAGPRSTGADGVSE